MVLSPPCLFPNCDRKKGPDPGGQWGGIGEQKKKKNTENAGTKPLHNTESTNKAYACIAELIIISISSTRQLLVAPIELELIGVGVVVGLGLGSGVSVGVCWPMPPYPSSLYVRFVHIQLDSIYFLTFILKEEKQEGILDPRTCQFGLMDSIGSPL